MLLIYASVFTLFLLVSLLISVNVVSHPKGAASMIDRYALACDWTSIIDYFKIPEYNYAVPPQYNIPPGKKVPAVIADNKGTRRIGGMVWGVVPQAWGIPDSNFRPADVRAEGIATNTTFRNLLRKKRCIIPATGFYYMRSNDKQLFHIKLTRREVFGMAGIYDSFLLESGERLTTMAVIVTPSSFRMKTIGKMMPAILKRVDEHFWLDRSETDVENLLTVLQPYENDDLYAYPVQNLIQNVANNSPECIQSIR